MSQNLAEKECVPCKGGVPPMEGAEVARLLEELGGGWKAADGRRLEKVYTFRNFREALAFTNKIGEIAERQGHHPDINLAWGMVKVAVWTHKINGLTESDFIFAAKVEEMANRKAGNAEPKFQS